jgi:hypothetical protein
MTPSIPASAIVNVTPNVIGAGGTGLDLNGLILTITDYVPVGTVMSFATAQDVADFFGPLSAEAAMAAIYFAGFDGSNIKPASLLFVQYVENIPGVPPYLRSGDVSGMTVAQLQALGSGTLGFTINGRAFTSGTINLSATTSFSNAAALIQAGLAHYDAVVTGSIAGTTLTVTAVTSGTLRIGQTITGAGITPVRIGALGTGTGGTGTYTIEGGSQTVSSTTISAGQTIVSYNSQLGSFEVFGGTPGANGGTVSYATGALSAGLKLTAATGAIQSAGTSTMTPAGAMDAVVANTQNFASFTTTFKPSVADMVAFAAWANGQDNRFLYAMWDDNITVATVQDDPATAGYLVAANDYSGTVPIYDPLNGQNIAAFVMGTVASLDFTQTEGRTNVDLRSQSGLAAGVTSATVRNMLIANGYNFYGSFATANDEFTFFNSGTVSGPFAWIDSYVNQIWMNNGFQLALMVLLTSVRSIPYNSAGYGLIESAMLAQVEAAVNFGAVRAGVTLSALQIAQVNAAAGLNISDTIQQRGWYIQVKNASADVRAARGSPPVTFWYTDGQSVQSINLASVEVQ